MQDLFGVEVPDTAPIRRRRPRAVSDRAHAGTPGSGPEGETCQTCGHRSRVEYHAKVFQKCDLRKADWTHGPGTDIHCRDAACHHWTDRAGE